MRARPAGPAEAVRLAAAAGAALVAISSSGDVLLLGVLLGLAALDVAAGGAAVLAGLAVLLRWGSPSLGALAGGQAVLGPAGWVGPPLAAASAWCAAGALVLAAPAQILTAVAFGSAAAAVVAGPAPGGALWVRLVASVVAAGVALLAGRRLPRRSATVVALVAATAACVLAAAT